MAKAAAASPAEVARSGLKKTAENSDAWNSPSANWPVRRTDMSRRNPLTERTSLSVPLCVLTGSA